MSKTISLGLATDTGSIVCQRCGLYFTPEKAGQKVCPSCRKVKRKGYQVDSVAQVSDTDRAIGLFLGFIIVLAILIGIGAL